MGGSGVRVGWVRSALSYTTRRPCVEGLMSIHSCVLLSDDGCQMSHLRPVRWDKAGLGLGSRIAPHHVWCPGPHEYP